MTRQQSLRAYFREPLGLGQVEEDEHPKAVISDLARQIDPPLVLVKQCHSKFSSLVDQMVVVAKIKGKTAPRWYDVVTINNAMSVHAASSTYLMLPTTQVLFGYHPEGGLGMGISQDYEHDTTGSTTWYETGDHTVFACMDFQPPGVIRLDEFEEASVEYEELETKLQEKKTLLKGNSSKVVQMALALSKLHKAKYVGVSDWKTLVLFVFVNDTWCWTTIIQDRSIMKLAWLGFLECGWKDMIGFRS